MKVSNPQDDYNALLQPILEAMAAAISFEYACIWAYDPEFGRLERVAIHPYTPGYHTAESVEPLLAAGIGGQIQILTADQLAGTDFRSGLVVPCSHGQQVTGLVVVLATAAAAYALDDADRLSAWLPVVRTVLDNKQLNEDQAVAQAIQDIAQVVGETPSPQDLIDRLVEHLFGPHVTTSVLMLYGPLREDRPNGPFDYLEVRGTWSKRRGSAVGLGLRLYLTQYPDILNEVSERKVLFVPRLRQVKDRLDPLVRGFLRAERIHSLVLIALHAAQRRLGMLLIATDRPYRFPANELRAYRTISEFIAMSAVAQVLQQQQDFVQRGRAALLDAVKDGVMMVLPNAGTAHVLTVNHAFTRMFHLTQARAQGLTLSQVLDQMQVPGDVGQELRDQWLGILVSDPTTLHGEFEMIHPEGYPASIEWYSAPVYQGNRVLGRIFTFHDVSAERTAARLRATFLSRVSHELRTPLTSIKGFAQFILEEANEDLPPLAHEYLSIILNSARHLNLLFTDIIEISRAEAGELHLNLENAHMPDVIINTVALFELQYKQRGQTVSMDLDDDLPPVHIDVSRVMQVLSNLIGNAIKYSPPNSKIRILTERITNTKQLPPNAPPGVVTPAVLVIVADEGQGLSPEDAEQVFLPFFRTKEASASKVEGTGLGLTIARSIIELQRGKIWAEPRRRGRRGGRFLFTLPTVEG